MTKTTRLFEFIDYELALGSSTNTLIFRYRYLTQPTKSSKPTEEIAFEEKFVLPSSVKPDPDDPTTKYILQCLHIIVGVSYYKCHLGEIIIPYPLDEEESQYWNDVYDNGLGEFAYVNSITNPIRPFMISQSSIQKGSLSDKKLNPVALLGIGGGKDSIVACRMLREAGVETKLMSMGSRNHHGQAGAVCDAIGGEKYSIDRYIDTKIVDYGNKTSGLTGHIPLSAIIAWLEVLIAYTLGAAYATVGNESSSSEGNVMWSGKIVNHQWSKSLEFETMTSNFVHSYISPGLHYFSTIRQFSSLAVIKKLSEDNSMDQLLTSCNKVLTIEPSKRPNGRWCSRCAKCLSTWLLMSPWKSQEELSGIFGSNILLDSSLRALAYDLLGLANHKPLDCVGTTDELRAVTRYIIDNNLVSGQDTILNEVKSKSIPGPDIESLLAQISKHNLPDDLTKKISC